MKVKKQNTRKNAANIFKNKKTMSDRSKLKNLTTFKPNVTKEVVKTKVGTSYPINLDTKKCFKC